MNRYDEFLTFHGSWQSARQPSWLFKAPIPSEQSRLEKSVSLYYRAKADIKNFSRLSRKELRIKFVFIIYLLNPRWR